MRRAIGPRQHDLLAALAAAPPPSPPGPMRHEWTRLLTALLLEVAYYRHAQSCRAKQEVGDEREDHG